ncbi:hypothetical protein Y032_0040g198 [Ancylostoma ceylanicum]|uniref:Sulfotransferase domain-containing protein n=1 Tax=Ancylostoma ceylanicum TaxID=53326 RepID=A0A016UGY1_9BILA|nr:hypothetical protein Y032_0040g198 [Ancylostoma ceylanicum]
MTVSFSYGARLGGNMAQRASSTLRRFCPSERECELIAPFKRYSPQYTIAGWPMRISSCMIPKNMSTVLSAIFCLLFTGEMGNTNSTVTTMLQRKCAGRNELHSYSQIAKLAHGKRWMNFAMVRDPAERFLSGFMFMCSPYCMLSSIETSRLDGVCSFFAQTTCTIYYRRTALFNLLTNDEDKHVQKRWFSARSTLFFLTLEVKNNPVKNDCEGCVGDVKCALKKTLEQSQQFANGDLSAQSYLLWHLGPQNWHCDLQHNIEKFKLIQYSPKKEEKLAADLLYVLEEGGVERSNIDLIIAQVSNGTTLHATNHLVRKKFYEMQMNDAQVHELLVKIFFWDYVIFKYPLPKLGESRGRIVHA